MDLNLFICISKGFTRRQVQQYLDRLLSQCHSGNENRSNMVVGKASLWEGYVGFSDYPSKAHLFTGIHQAQAVYITSYVVVVFVCFYFVC